LKRYSEMCWDYSDCGNCGHRTYCVTACLCEPDDICKHRDCKSWDRCFVCSADLCDDCDDPCDDCEEQHCSECACPATQ